MVRDGLKADSCEPPRTLGAVTRSTTQAPIAPGGFPVVGIIGAGQLARMCTAPAVELALTLSIFAESEDAAAALVVPHSPVGDYTDPEAVREWARGCDVVTFDHEHVPADVLSALEADGVPMHPKPSALRFAQDKLAMRERLEGLGVPCPAWRAVVDVDELAAFGDEHGWPVVLKTPTGGYDGKGVRVVKAAEDAADWFAKAEGAPLLVEEAVDFTRELSVMIGRSPSGQVAVWPVVETVQTDGICTEVLAPAPNLDDALAGRIAEAAVTIARELDVTGVMAVELFERVAENGSGQSDFVVNELAMRPHNSGHWSMDGAVTGQFEQHLRAVLDLPLGDVTARAPWTVMGNVLGGSYEELYPTYKHLMARDPALKIHLYGKGVRPGRKIGHVNVSGTDLVGLRGRARHACDYLEGVVTE